MIGWIKYLWGCDWSKENDISDSCQMLSQHESEILNDFDQRLLFTRLGPSISASRRKFLIKKDNCPRRVLAPEGQKPNEAP